MDNLELQSKISTLFLSNDLGILDNGTIVLKNIELGNEDLLELVKDLSVKSVASEFECNGQMGSDFSVLLSSDVINLHVDTSFLRSKIGFSFYEKIDDFLYSSRTKRGVDYFYIHELKATHEAISEHVFFKYYDSVCLLQNIVKNISVDDSEVLNKTDCQYIIFDKKKLVITSVYRYADILVAQQNKNFFSSISNLQDEILNGENKKTNVLFLINALESVFSNVKNEISFADILRELENIYEEYQVHHRAYINSLEPGKLKEAFEKEIKDSLGKLTSLLSDVNNKMIFLPIAFIVSLGQLGESQTPKNIIIFLGMLIFCLLLRKFSEVQKEVLQIIKDDVNDKKEWFDKNVSKFSKELEPKMRKLLKLVLSIEERLRWSEKLTWVALFIVFAAMLYYR